jgi:hypothetical protein
LTLFGINCQTYDAFGYVAARTYNLSEDAKQRPPGDCGGPPAADGLADAHCASLFYCRIAERNLRFPPASLVAEAGAG